MIKAPFNFVPISSKVYYPGWSNQVSSDVPFSDGEDGIIELVMQNETAMFTRNGHKRNEDEHYSSFIKNDKGEKQYFIPGSTIKGSIRSVMEIISSAKVGFYNNDSFGMQREFDTKNSTNSIYSKLTKNVKSGWLIQKDDGYVIYPCRDGVQFICHDDIRKRFPGFNIGEDHKTAEIKQSSLQPNGDYFPILQVDDDEIISTVSKKERKYVPAGVYRVVCTGFMADKKKEYLFSALDKNVRPLDVASDVFKSFESVHKRTVYYAGHGADKGILKTKLYSGEPIPVFYTTDNNKVDAIGITYKFRVPYKFSVRDAINNARNGVEEMDRPDLPETIFGYIDNNHKCQSLKSRVMFGNAFCDAIIPDTNLVRVKGVLGQPSASFYPLYVKQTNAPFVTWQDDCASIAGRKRYRISAGSQVNRLPEGNNEEVESLFYAIPAGQTFICRIIIHNLRKVEIGALISALTMNNTNGCFLNIGLAKSFGFGKMRCSIGLKKLKYSIEEYIYAFEHQMMSEGVPMVNNESLDKFVAIASEHTPESMIMMNLDEYGDAKNNEKFSTLSEIKRNLNTYLSKYDFEQEQKLLAEKKKERINELIEEADSLLDNCAFEDALKLYQEANTMGGFCELKINNCINTIVGMSVAEAEKLCAMNRFAEAIKLYEKAEGYGVSCSEQKLLCERKMRESTMSLSEIVTISKDSSIAAIAGRIKKYSGTVTEDECKWLGEQLKDAFTQMNSKNRKSWGDFKNWKPIIDALQSEEEARSIFNAISNE